MSAGAGPPDRCLTISPTGPLEQSLTKAPQGMARLQVDSLT